MGFCKSNFLGLVAGGLLLIVASAQPASAAGPALPGRSAVPTVQPAPRPANTLPALRPPVERPASTLPALRPPIDPTNRNGQMPPGWDWWRTYPYSPYNAWRNPYWYPPYNPYYPFPPDEVHPYYPYPVPPVPFPGGIGTSHK
jgi:hypothetical protein